MPVEVSEVMYVRTEVRNTKPVLIGLLFALLIAAYWQTIAQTAALIWSSEDMAHGLFAPIIAVYLIWVNRHIAFRESASPNRWALPVLVLAGCVAILGTIGGSTTFSRFALLISLASCIVLTGGLWALRVLLFPLFLLLFTFPIPQVLYGEVTLPLQLLATRLSEQALDLLGYTALREGNILQMPHGTLSVVEACSGIKSLVTLTFLTLVYSRFFAETRSIRILITISAVPAAILLNVFRITITGVLLETAPRFSHGFYHETLGWLCFTAAFGLVLVLHLILRKCLLKSKR
jgi:exosortase